MKLLVGLFLGLMDFVASMPIIRWRRRLCKFTCTARLLRLRFMVETENLETWVFSASVRHLTLTAFSCPSHWLAGTVESNFYKLVFGVW